MDLEVGSASNIGSGPDAWLSAAGNGFGKSRNSLGSSNRSTTILVAGGCGAEERSLGAVLDGDNYRVLKACQDTEVHDLLECENVDLILLDSAAAGMSAFECCRRIKSNRRTELIPVVLWNGAGDLPAQLVAISCGADDFLNGNMQPEALRNRIDSLLRQREVSHNVEQSEAILFALAKAVEMRDRYTGGHCERLAVYSVALGMSLGLSHEELLSLYRGGFLHDIGKIAMPDSILFKPGKLTPEEWSIMKTHPVLGEGLCQNLKSLNSVLPIIRNHHERWDGSGYPDQMEGSAIPLLARVLQLGDIYDALTTERPYKPALEPRHALTVMEEEAGRGWRDPHLMSVFTGLHHRTLVHSADFISENSRDAGAMRESLRNLQDCLSRS